MSERIKKMMPFAFFEGEICESDSAKISIASHSVQYGTSCFSGIRGYFVDGETRIFRIYDHFERLKSATKIFGMKIDLDFESFKEALLGLIKANKPDGGFYFRPFIYTDDEELTPKFDGLNFKLAIYMIKLGDYLDTTRGLKLMVSSWKKFSDASISTKAKAGGSYLHSSMARSEATRCGYDEALVMDDNWNIVEGSAENIAIVYRGEVILPEVGSSMLEGITMRTVVDLLRDEGVPIRFEKIDRSMIYTCDELLLTGTGAQIVFAESVDDRVVSEGNMGAICTMLRNKFQDLIAMKHPRSEQWVTIYKY